MLNGSPLYKHYRHFVFFKRLNNITKIHTSNYCNYQELLAEASEIEPTAEGLKKSSDELQKELGARPEGDRVAEQTTEVTDEFTNSHQDLADLVKRLEKYSVVADEFSQSYEDLEEWLPKSKDQVAQLKPISTRPDVIEEQIHETEVS